MLKLSPWGHSKSTYALKEEGGDTTNACENAQRDAGLPRVYVHPYYF